MTGMSSISAKNVAYYATDFLRIWCITQTAIAQFVRVGFEVSHVDSEDRISEIEIMYAIMGCSAVCALGTVAANIRYGRKTEERLFASLSPPFLFFLMDLFSGPQSISLGWFIGLSIFSWVAAYGFSAYATPIPDDESLVLLPSQIKALNLPRYPAASLVERGFNIARFTQMSLFSFAAFLTLMSREFAGKSVELSFWGYEVLAVASVVPAVVGYHLTDDPKFARGFAAFPICFFEDASFIYTALSAWFSLALTDDKIEKNRMLYIHLCGLITVAIATFSAGKEHFDPEKIHEKNELWIGRVKQLPDYLDEKRRNTIEACGDFGKTLSRCRDSFVHALPNPRKWCSDDLPAVDERVALV